MPEPGDVGKGREKPLMPDRDNDPAVFCELFIGGFLALDFKPQKGEVQPKKGMAGRKEPQFYEISRQVKRQ